MPYDPSAAAVLDAVPATPRVDLFALTRALVFTKEDYRMLRAQPAGPRQRPPVDDEAATRAIEAALKSAVESGPAHADPQVDDDPGAEVPPTVEMRIASSDVVVPTLTLVAEAPTAPADPLTPWDLIEEEDGSGGVTFARFQARRRPATRRQQAA